MIVVINHQDSFVHNLARYFVCAGAQTRVVEYADFMDIQDATALVFSPGPGAPEDFPSSVALIQQYHEKIPILGVCLGHQMLAYALGGKVGRAAFPRHGIQSKMQHTNTHIMKGLPNPLDIGHYHSLIVQIPPPDFTVLGYSSGDIMAMQKGCTVGVQFHPESILTTNGKAFIEKFLLCF